MSYSFVWQLLQPMITETIPYYTVYWQSANKWRVKPRKLRNSVPCRAIASESEKSEDNAWELSRQHIIKQPFTRLYFLLCFGLSVVCLYYCAKPDLWVVSDTGQLVTRLLRIVCAICSGFFLFFFVVFWDSFQVLK